MAGAAALTLLSLHSLTCAGCQRCRPWRCRAGTDAVLVDPFFRDAFLQQPATPSYNRLLQQLPRGFVGSPLQLRQLLALLVTHSKHAYAVNVSGTLSCSKQQLCTSEPAHAECAGGPRAHHVLVLS